MRNKLLKIVTMFMVGMMVFAFSSSSFAAITTIMDEGEFAKFVRAHSTWFWGSTDNGILAKSGKTAYFGKNLTPGGDAAHQTNGACLYHLKKHLNIAGNPSNNYFSRITNLVEFDGATGTITIYGGKDSTRTKKETIKWGNANATANILYTAYQKKGNSTSAASKWGAAVYYAINQSKGKIKTKVHTNFFTDSNSAYTTSQKNFAKKEYSEAKDSNPVEPFNLKFDKNLESKATVAVQGGTTYTYLGPFKITGTGTIKDVVVAGNYKYSAKQVRWSTTANSNGLKDNIAITKGKNFYLRVKADLSSTKNIKVKITTKSGKYYQARVALITYLCGTHTSNFSSQNLGIYRGKVKTVESNQIETTVKQPGIPDKPNTPPPSGGGDDDKPEKGNLDIIKQDTDTGAKLAGVSIRVTGPNQYDKTFKTDAQGKISLTNLTLGTYTIKETANPYYGYTVLVNSSINLQNKTKKTVVLKNTKQTGNLKINKVDKDNGTKLAGVSFKIKASNGNYIIAEVNQTKQSKITGKAVLSRLHYTSNEQSATEFVTDQDGLIEIHNLMADTYQVIETSVGSNTYYEVDDHYITWESNINANGQGRVAQVRVNRRASNQTQDTTNGNVDTVTVKNRRKYLNLGGGVWQDIEFDETKDKRIRNGLWQEANTNDKFDQPLQGIEVQLKNKEGKIVATTHTGQDGRYQFPKVVIDDLASLYIEFSYNGMSYQSVVLHLDKDNGSKATEGEEQRDKFNHNYETITYDGSNQYPLEYKTSDYESKLKFGEESNYNYGYDADKNDRGDRGPVNGVDEKFRITANTYQAYVKKDGTGGYLDSIQSAEDIREEGMTEIGTINLGIEKREQPNLNLVKDLYSIQVGINHATHVYNYNDIFKKPSTEIYHAPQVKFQIKDGSYTRSLYASDIYYEGEDPLSVKATYKIGIHNDSSSLTSVIHKIEDYYTDSYYGDKEHVQVGTKIDKNGNIQEGTELDFQFVTSKYAGYCKMEIQDTIEVGREDKYVYVQLEVKPNQIVNLLNQNNLCNIAEIASYSTQKDGKVYAAVDRNSRPGNIEIGNTKTYEWDTCKAPGLQLVLQDERKMDGVIFEDNVQPVANKNANELMTGEKREGNGIYDTNEKTVEGVKVQLVLVNQEGEIQHEEDGNVKLAQLYQYVEVDSEGNTQYDEKGNVKLADESQNKGAWKWIPATYVTEEDGAYSFAGCIPDNYKLIYTWGGQHRMNDEEKTIRVQDYKGTIYKDKDRQANVEWYKKDKTTRYSDAMDDANMRKAIDDQSATINFENKTTIEQYKNEGEMREYDTDGMEKDQKSDLMTKMQSLTPTFRVNIEYEETMDTSKEYQLDDRGAIVMKGNYAVKKEEYQNYLQNVDFGIVERPRQVLQLDKEIERIKVTLANGTVLMDAEVEVGNNGKLKFKNPVKNTVCIPESEQAKAQIKMEIDNEIIQGAKLEITYALKVTNISELDYVDDKYEYYYYGEETGNFVQLRANKIIDYLDNNIAVSSDNQTGQVVEQQKKNTLVEQGLYEKMSDKLKETKKVLLVKDFTTDLKPKEEETKKVVLSKLLSNISIEDEMVFDNCSEIMEIVKTGGSSLITKPGNYTQKLGSTKEYDEDESATVTILPPTGSNTNMIYITYTIVGISLLGIFILGIIWIKKFVLK